MQYIKNVVYNSKYKTKYDIIQNTVCICVCELTLPVAVNILQLKFGRAHKQQSEDFVSLLPNNWASQEGSSGKDSTCQCRRHKRRDSIPGVGKIH